MSRERLDLPPTREHVLAEYAEIRSYGASPDDAAKRVGVPLATLEKWEQSERECQRRRVREGRA